MGAESNRNGVLCVSVLYSDVAATKTDDVSTRKKFLGITATGEQCPSSEGI